MDDFKKPIRPISREDRDKVKAEPIIEKFRDPLNQDLPSITKKNKTQFILSYLGFVRQFFNFFIPERAGVSGVLGINDLWQDLKLIKNLLVKIRDENPTGDLKFAQQLSEVWIRLLNQVSHLSSGDTCVNDTRVNDTRVKINKVQQLVHAIQHYPEGEDHSLGFYLKRYSEQEWFPIPFFKLLTALHEECFTQGKNSDLDRWIALVSEILIEAAKA